MLQSYFSPESLFIGLVHYGREEILNPLMQSFPDSLKPCLHLLNHGPEPLQSYKEVDQEDFSNPGFASGMNRLILQAMGEGKRVFVGLNPDLILEPSAIENLVQALFDHQARLAQGLLVSRQGTCLCGAQDLWPDVFWIRSIHRHVEVKSVQDRELNFVCGAFFALDLHATVFEEICFDPEFFVYFEDWEWSRRLKQKGHKLVLASQARAIHLESQTSGGGITRQGIRLRWQGLRILLKKWQSGCLYTLLSYMLFWVRMSVLWVWQGRR